MRFVMLAVLLASLVARAEEQEIQADSKIPPAIEIVEQKAPDTRVEQTVGERELLDEDGYTLRLSLPTAADFDQWQESGFRVSLAYLHGQQFGYGTAPTLASA